MDLIVIPQALLMFYGFLVLGCGSALGFILSRNFRKQISEPDPPLLASPIDHDSEIEITQVKTLALKDDYFISC